MPFLELYFSKCVNQMQLILRNWKSSYKSFSNNTKQHVYYWRECSQRVFWESVLVSICTLYEAVFQHGTFEIHVQCICDIMLTSHHNLLDFPCDDYNLICAAWSSNMVCVFLIWWNTVKSTKFIYRKTKLKVHQNKVDMNIMPFFSL